MKAEKTQHLQQAFVLKDGNVRKFDQILAMGGGNVKYEAKTTDDITFKCDNVDIFLNEACATNLLTQLRIYIVSSDAEQYASVILDGSGSPIFYHLDCDEKETKRLDSQIRQWLAEIKPWYSWLAFEINLVRLWGRVMLALAVVAVLPVAWAFLFSPKSSQNGAFSGELILFGIVIGGILGLCLAVILSIFQDLITKLVLRIFPAATFAVGQGFLKYQESETRRRILGGIFSVLGTLLLALLGNWLSRGFH